VIELIIAREELSTLMLFSPNESVVPALVVSRLVALSLVVCGVERWGLDGLEAPGVKV